MKRKVYSKQLFVIYMLMVCWMYGCSPGQPTDNKQPSQTHNGPARPPIRLPDYNYPDRQNNNQPKKEEKILHAVKTSPLSTEQVEQFLKDYYLPSVFSGYESTQDETDSPFYGITNWNNVRMEWHFSSVKQDSLLARRFYVSGKRRLEDQIVPFEGYFTIDSMHKVEDENIDEALLEKEGFKALYTATGNFEFNEPTGGEENGSHWGSLTVDLAVRRQQYPYEENELDTWNILYKPGTYPAGPGFAGICNGAGFQMKGYFSYYHIKRTRDILVAENLLMIIDDYLPKFMSDNPNPHINPKYRELGWENAVFEGNDPWWEEAEGDE